MVNERLILQGVAEEIAPGAVVSDPQKFEEFLATKAQEFDLSAQNEQLRQQITQLGGNPRVSGVGVGQTLLESENRALRNRLATLQAPLRQGGPTVAEVQQNIGPGVTEFIFPGVMPVNEGPGGAVLGGNALTDVFSPIVGLPEERIQNLPGPAAALVRAVQTTISPGSLVGAVAAPAALLGAAGGTGRAATAARFLADTPGRSLALEAGANLGSEAAAEAGAPVPVQIAAGFAGAGAAGVAPFLARAARQSVTDPRRAFDAASPVGFAEAANVEEGFIRPNFPTPSRGAELLDIDDAVIPVMSGRSEELTRTFGVAEPVVGLSRKTTVLNQVRSAVRGRGDGAERNAVARALGATKDEVVDPAFQNRDEIIRNAQSRAVVTIQRVSPSYRGLFNPLDNGLLPSLRGVDPSLTAAPTIQDVAARLPRYWARLTPEQRGFMTSLRDELEPVAAALREAGDDFGARSDIIDGGFYLPRGGDILDPDAPLAPMSGGRRPGSTPGFLRAASRESMGDAIADGAEYVPFEEALAKGFIERSGRRVADLTTAEFLKNVRDVDGTKFGLTAKELVLQQNPKLVEAMANLRGRILRLQGLLSGKHEQLDRAAGQFLDDPAFTDIKSVDNALERINLVSAVAEARNEANALRPFANAAQTAEPRIRSARTVQRGRSAGADISRLRQEIRETRKLLREITPTYQAALRSVTRGRRTIGSDVLDFPQLNGVTFPERMAARAEELLKEERGRLSGNIETVNEIQNIFKGMQATLDDSGVGIQALLSGFARNPVATLKALKINIRSFGTANAYADWAQNFNRQARARNFPTLEQWTDAGVRQLSPGQFDVTSTLPERIPGVGGAFRGANRAFATISNVVRAGWAEDLLMEELAKGRTLDEIIASGSLQRIAKHVNTATGVVDGDFHVANLVTFSARFMAARIATIYRALRGLDIDAPVDAVPVLGPRISARIPSVNRAARLEDKLARRAVLRMMAFGTMMTVALNESQGRETDFRPVVDGRYNSNFMRFRWADRDWSLFGPWDSLARLFVSAGTGNAKAAVRSIASAPGVSLAIDLFENRDFFGREIVDTDGNAPKQAADVLARLAESTVPFALNEAPELLESIAENAGDGHLAGIGETVLTGAGEAFGVKSSPLSTMELQELLRQRGLPEETRGAILAEINERRAQRSTSASERLLPFLEEDLSRPSAGDLIRGLR